MTLRVRPGFKSRLFRPDQLQELAAALQIDFEARGVRAVYFGQNPPADTSLPWQMTDGTETPIGPIKYYRAGGWNS